MKNAASRPLLRWATAHSCAVSNPTKPKAGHAPALPLLTRNYYTSSEDSCVSTVLSPRPNFRSAQRAYSTTARPTHNKYSKLVPFSTLAILGVMLLFGKAEAFSLFGSKHPTPTSRMKERLEKHGFMERPVSPDGNCQMRAIADQLYGTDNNHKDVRSKITSWLAKNERFSVDEQGSAAIGDFIDRDAYPKWVSYVSHMSRDKAWGDHITLLAAAEVYGVNIFIISNVDDLGTGQYITNIAPKSKKAERTLNLSHWHEQHYNSLYPVNKQSSREL